MKHFFYYLSSVLLGALVAKIWISPVDALTTMNFNEASLNVYVFGGIAGLALGLIALPFGRLWSRWI